MLYLVRHGETDWNKQKLLQGHTNIPLNEQGKRQAKQLAEKFKDIRLDRIYASDLERAVETARTVGAKKGITDVQMFERLRERCFGEMEGIEVVKLDELLPNCWTNWGEDSVHGIEPLEEMQSRMAEQLRDIMEEAKEEHVLVVSHGAAINSFIHFVTKGESGTGILRLKNTAVTSFTYKEGEWEMVTCNDDSHLEIPVS
ncbi:histidine phosphatase family protein [Priestia koreensis]|uniref:histidine phosphatase family protein n=1 Tax=Priestia koreensis TaxID=284581 RepID=UPI001F58871D|nr:histidine phosphatase family protein [Priestia koreensis]UNL85751.1 histidine phosphatase family protein [Priestia koreensis]